LYFGWPRWISAIADAMMIGAGVLLLAVLAVVGFRLPAENARAGVDEEVT
jgi:hypothetical protein